MSKAMLSHYDKRTKDTIEILRGDKRRIRLNTWYETTQHNGIYWYENSKGYYHILKPIKGKFYENTYYAIIDYLLKPDNTMKEVKRYGNFNTIDDMKAFIESNMSKGE